MIGQRSCPVCGKDLTYKRAAAIYCSGRCGKRAQRARERGETPTAPVDVPKPQRTRWPRFIQLCGPLLSDSQLHCAGVSDRDYENGYSAYLETEERNRRGLRVGLWVHEAVA
jgi:hypothetical protein